MSGPLQGLSVVDLSERSPAAAVAGMVLGDFGAAVTRVEPPGGDPLRALPAHAVWTRNQRTVDSGLLDVDELDRLCRSADVLIDTLHPRRLNPSPWQGPAAPEQVVCLLTGEPAAPAEVGLGSAGEKAVYGELLEARYGLLLAQQGHRPGPIFEAWPHAVHGAAWLIQIGVLAALHARARGQGGQVVTTSLADGLAILSTARWVGTEKSGPGFQRSVIGGPGTGNRTVVSGLIKCSDGRWVQIHTGARGAFERLFAALGRPDLAEPEADVDPATRVLSQARIMEIWEFLQGYFAARPSAELVHSLGEADVSAMPALGPGEALTLPQMEANGLVRVENGTRSYGVSAKFERTPAGPAAEPHAVSVPVAPAATNGSGPGKGLLDGLLVLDFGIWIAGPFANRIFADLGARVIKIEELSGDPLRGTPRHFLSSHRGKEGIALNLKTEAAQEVVRRLAARADIVHHNMRVGVMERLGAGYEQLKAIKPDLIYCHSSGYGNAGEWARLPAFEPLHSAVAGMLTRTGGPGRPPLHYLSHMDFGCALTSAVAVLAALAHRDRTGEGQYLECPQVGSAMLAMADVYLERGEPVDSFEIDPDQHGHAASNAVYSCSDGSLVIAAGSEVEWRSLHEALGVEGRETYAEARRLRFDRSAAASRLARRLGGMTVADASAALAEAGVPHQEPVEVTSEEALNQTGVGRIGGIERAVHPELGRMFAVGQTMRFSSSHDWSRGGPPRLGEHTAEVLEELGYSLAERDQLFGSGATAGPRA
jgi:crotonobetainyl-CoA:carnitine CoA-transferase CaiB-like acyl-CoA transferase